MYPSVKDVTPNSDYTLLVIFDNGESGTLDIKPMLNFGVFQRLRDFEAFKRVRVSFDTLEWECGVDLDPEYVYSRCCGRNDLRGPDAVPATGGHDG